jgi:hypothetical protein
MVLQPVLRHAHMLTPLVPPFTRVDNANKHAPRTFPRNENPPRNRIRFPFEPLRVSSYHLLTSLFSECRRVDLRLNFLCDPAFQYETAAVLCVVALIVLLLAALTYGSWIPGGVFVPSLLMGACIGRAVGTLVQILHQNYPHSPLFYNCQAQSTGTCITPAIYAIVGYGMRV